MYANQLPPDHQPEEPKQPRDPFNRPPALLAAEKWRARQYFKGWWVLLPSVTLAFMAPWWLTPTLETMVICLAGAWISKNYIRKFFMDNWTHLQQGEEFNWSYLYQLIYVHLITVGIAAGWILLFVYTAYQVITQEPVPDGSGPVQRNPSGGLIQ